MTVYENEKIKAYAEEIPAELRRVIDALNSDIGLAIFLVLFKYGEMSFSQIMSELDIPPNYSSKLVYHIKKLQKSALVKNEYIKKKNVESYSFYNITEFGEGILNNLMNAILVPQSSNYSIQTLDGKFTLSSTTSIQLKTESSESNLTIGSSVSSGSKYKISLDIPNTIYHQEQFHTAKVKSWIQMKQSNLTPFHKR
jgi:hypothetical protein